MTILQQVLTVAAVVLGTMTTRFLPFSSLKANSPRRLSVTWAQCFPAQSSACWWSFV